MGDNEGYRVDDRDSLDSRLLLNRLHFCRLIFRWLLCGRLFFDLFGHGCLTGFEPASPGITSQYLMPSGFRHSGR